MNGYEDNLRAIKDKLGIEIDEDLLFNIMFEMHRYFDNQFTSIIKASGKKYKQNERNLLRKYFYYGILESLDSVEDRILPRYQATDNDRHIILNSFISRCNTYGDEKITKSFIERYQKICNKDFKSNASSWLKIYNSKRERLYSYSLFVLDYSQEDFVKDNFQTDNILFRISSAYDQLENYRYFVFKLNGRLIGDSNEDLTWKVLYKIGIYCENFIQYKKNFGPFKKEKQIESLSDFLNKRFGKNSISDRITKQFYNSISTGYKFEDCFVSESQQTILLTYQKIMLDCSPVPCPSCMTTIQSGNSFPEMFLRSYECKNPNCPERSKSGRGKRFDEYGTYRFFKLDENNKNDNISDELYTKWRKDVFSDNNDVYEMLANFYAWHGETICVSKDINRATINGRIIVKCKHYQKTNYNSNFEKLPIVELFSQINTLISNISGSRKLKKKIEIINGDSTKEITNLLPHQIGAAITSPPYYNAREYSQWSNLLLYLTDMMINAKAIYNTLCNNGFYLYNIGDIVDRDNIFIDSNMSKKRLQLGFLSSLIFEICGFNIVGNIVWNKGEVQSKRNSTPNHFSGYIKPINCYEHVLIFKKGTETRNLSNVATICPVIKINCKGENIYKHTAPYPLELVKLIEPFVIEGKYVLDPFLGSGTTLKWCKLKHIQGVGFEQNNEYYNLAKQNINNLELLENE